MKVVWTKFALNALLEVFTYYKTNVGLAIAINIRNNILSSTRQLQNFPLSCPTEELLEDIGEGHRCLIRGNYKVIYKIVNEQLFITDVFDTRQNPEKIKGNIES
jgi:plasmid stabilization system protein ParE